MFSWTTQLWLPPDIAKVAYLEIYNETVRDLLHPTTQPKSIAVRDDGEGGIIVMGVQEVEVEGPQNVQELLEIGNVQRTTAATLMNDTSSRSHSIFTIVLEQVCHQYWLLRAVCCQLVVACRCLTLMPAIHPAGATRSCRSRSGHNLAPATYCRSLSVTI